MLKRLGCLIVPLLLGGVGAYLCIIAMAFTFLGG